MVPLSASAQADFSNFPYLLRLERENSEGHFCVLLQKSGVFHLEVESGESTKVFEGTLPSDNLHRIESDLNNAELISLSQKQIDEPLLRSRDLLQLNIFRDDHWQDLIFHSLESEEPYRRSLQPLVRWLEDLRKVPHKELSEDEGKNNCLTPRRIVLKKREENIQAEEPVQSSPLPAPRAQQPALAISKHEAVPVLFRMLSMKKTSVAAEQRCVLVKADGAYRTEQRVQKIGSKKAESKIDGGMMTIAEVGELEQILNDRDLADIRHHQTSQMVLPMSGEMLEVQVNRASGPQDIVLSATFNRRDVPFFYSGDGDIASAQMLLKFLAEHVENNQLGALDPGLRNDCTDAP